MVQKKVYIEYRELGVLTNAYEVVLAAQPPATGGLVKTLTGEVILADGALVDNPSTGRYEKILTLEENTVYTVRWRVTPNFGSQPKYASEQIGPYSNTGTIRAVADNRGSFAQATRATMFLRVTDHLGNPRDATPITCSIINTANVVVRTGVPERAAKGFYAFDWDIDATQATGAYTVQWNYTVDVAQAEVQQIVVTPTSETSPPSLYASRILEFRQSLEMMVTYAQSIAVYRELAKPSADNTTFQFTFGRWNQTPACRVYVNKEIQQTGLEVNYFKGTVTFDEPLTAYDTVEADYNFRWFSDEELDRFLSNSLHLVNLWPPVQRGVSLMNVQDHYIPLVMYGAAVDALRNLMMALQFQEPQMVFGGPEGAAKVYSNLEGLKKNYEETWSKGLEQKKNGSYVGLTRTIVTPEFALPGGRSRWFRYLFSGGV